MSQTPPPIHVRTIRLEASEAADGEILVTGTLVDERPPGGPPWFGATAPAVIHRMRVALRVRHRDLVITGIDAEMAAHPYRVCPEAIPPLARLVGTSVARGFTREVNARLGRQHGCAHLTALIHAMAPVVRQAAGVAFHDRPALGAAPDPLWFVGTCHAWRENGPLHALIERGDEAGLRALSAYGPPESETSAPNGAEPDTG